MANYEVTTPDGKRYEITAPDSMTPEQVAADFEANYKGAAPQANPKGGTLVDMMNDTQDQKLSMGDLFNDRIQQAKDLATNVQRGANRLHQNFALATGNYESVAQQERDLQALGTDPDVQALFDGGLGELFSNFAGLGNVALESAAQSMPPSVAGMATGGLIGSRFGPVGGMLGAAAGGAASSFGVEYQSTILNGLREAGVDLTDPEAIAAAGQNEQLMAELGRDALQRGVPIAAVDAFTMGMAGKPWKAIVEAYDGASKAAKAGRQVAGAGAEVGLQAGGGALGETLAQVADTGGIESGLDIAIEGLAEGPMAAVEATGMVAARAQAEAEQRIMDGINRPYGEPDPANSNDILLDYTVPVPEGVQQELNDQNLPTTVETPEEPPQEPKPANTKQVSTAAGNKVDVSLEVVELQDLITSDNPEYPQDLQPRERGDRASSEEQIQNIVANLDPERLGDSAEADRGAPIIGMQDNFVESGNGRVSALRKVYEAGDPESYKQYISGLTGQDLSGFSQPVLVRRRQTDMTREQRQQFALEANQSATMSLSATEQAQADAAAVKDIVGIMQGGDILSAGNRNFVKAFINKLPQSERNAAVDANGQLSQSGLRRIQGAVLGAAYGGKDSSKFLADILESTDDNVKAVTGAMMDMAPEYATFRASLDDDTFDISPNLIEAVQIVSQLREQGRSVAEWLQQDDLLGKPDENTELLIRSFYNENLTRAVGRDKVAEFIRYYTEEAGKETSQESMFGDTVEPGEILQAGLDRREDGKQDQGDLLNEPEDRGNQEGAEESGTGGTRRSPRGETGDRPEDVAGAEGKTEAEIENELRNADPYDPAIRDLLLYGLDENTPWADTPHNTIMRLYDFVERHKGNPDVKDWDQMRYGGYEVLPGMKWPYATFSDAVDNLIEYMADKKPKPKPKAKAKPKTEAEKYLDELRSQYEEGGKYEGLYALQNIINELELGNIDLEQAREMFADLEEREASRTVKGEVIPQGETKKYEEPVVNMVDISGSGYIEDLMFMPPLQTRDLIHDKNLPEPKTQEQADQQLARWKKHAKDQRDSGQAADGKANYERTVISLFDTSGVWSQPWVDAGYEVVPVDIQDGLDIMDVDMEYLVGHLYNVGDIYAVIAAPPCTVMTVANTRNWKAADEDGRTRATQEALSHVFNLIGWTKPTVWAIENPTNSRIGLTKTGKPRDNAPIGLGIPTLDFHPNHFGAKHEKSTSLWGNMNPDLPLNYVEATENMLNSTGGKTQEAMNIRSQTPEGFAYAFFMANNAIDNLVSLEPSDWRNKFTKLMLPGGAGPEIETYLDEVEGATPASVKQIADETGWEYNDDNDEFAAELRYMTGRNELPEISKADIDADQPIEGVAPGAKERRKRRETKRRKIPFRTRRAKESVTAKDAQIWLDAGEDIATVRSMPPERQFKIASRQFKAKFGFSEIIKDKDHSTREALDLLIDIYANARTMAAIMEMPESMISFGGKMTKLHLYSRGMNALAYHLMNDSPFPISHQGMMIAPGEQMIGVGRRNDSFAHEWGHALDARLLVDYMVDLDQVDPKGRLLSGQVFNQGIGNTTLGENVQAAFANLLNALFQDSAALAGEMLKLQFEINKTKDGTKKKAELQERWKRLESGANKTQLKRFKNSQMFENTKIAGGGSPHPYLARPTEMLARSFEAYIAYKAAALDANAEGLAREDNIYQSEDETQSYPTKDDRQHIFMAWDVLVQALTQAEILNPDQVMLPTEAKYKVELKAMQPDPRLDATLKKQQDNALKREGEKLKRNHKEAMRRIRENQVKAKTNDKGEYEGGLLDSNAVMLLDRYSRQAFGMVTWTIRGELLHLQNQYPMNEGIKYLVQKVATDPGSGRYQEFKYEDEVRRYTRKFMNSASDIINTHQINKMDEKQMRIFRDLLASTDENYGALAKKHPEYLRAVADVRELLDDLYNFMQSKGVEIGYAKNNYLTRIWDDLTVRYSPDAGRKFIEDAWKVYKIVFENDVHPIGLIDASNDEWRQEFTKTINRYKPNKKGVLKNRYGIFLSDEAMNILQDIEQLKEEIRKYNKALKKAQEEGNEADVEGINDKIADLIVELNGLYEEIHPHVQSAWARESALDWHDAIANPKAFKARRNANGVPATDFERARQLPPEADEIMADWLESDVPGILSTYISKAVRRAIYSEMFGNEKSGKPAGWELQEQLDIIAAEFTSRDFGVVSQGVAQILGDQGDEGFTRAAMRGIHTTKNAITAYLLQRALYSQIAEPTSTGMRAGEPIKATAEVYGAMIGDLFSSLKELARMGPTEAAKYRYEMARYLGVISDSAAQEILQNRFNLDAVSASGAQAYALMMKWSGQLGYTNANIRGATQVALRYIHEVAAKAKAGDENAVKLMAELGLTEAHYDTAIGFGPKPTIQQIEGSLYSRQIQSAVYRFVFESVMDPQKVDKSRFSNQRAWGGTVMGILSFAQRFQRMQIRLAKLAQNYGPSIYLPAISAFGLLIVLQGLVWTVRYAVTGDWEDEEEYWEKIKDQFVGQALTRTGVYGVLDPLVQAFAGLRYQRDITALTAGPTMGWMLQNLQEIMELGTDVNSPNTNTQEHNAVKALVDLSMFGAYTGIMHAPVPIPLKAAATLAGGQVTSSKVRGQITDQIVGEKDSKKKKKGPPQPPRPPRAPKP
jgi:hypothetical protein